ncbi:MAG: DNA primase [Kamptonema sp. SIO1D9]|nr:DNA primase [Kamptonema sp. SIO1D9]
MEVPRLHPNTIEEVKQRVDIVEAISDRVILRKSGREFKGLCPFHEEKTPSFTVSPSKQLYHCFGCGASGNVFKFFTELDKRSFGEVVFDLARRYQVPIQTLAPEEHQEFQRQLSIREQLYEILAVTASFYQHALRQPQGESVLAYLQSQRKFSEATIQQFGLGYAPAGWDTLSRYLVEAKRYPVGLVEQAGLIKPRKSGDGYIDRFRDRLMIPINDYQGRIIGFGGRSLGDEQPKYLNSPETQLFDKSKTLFALNRAKNEISKQDCAIVVEGYFDAIALHAVGITNVVASLGTALAENQLKLLLRYSESKQVILNFDADSAGTTATQRAITEIESLVYSGQVQLRILHLPDGKDADEFLKSSPDAVDKYRYLIANSPLWLDWQLQQLLVDKNLKDAYEYQQVAAAMVKLLNRMENPHGRTYYLQKCAELLAGKDSQLVDFNRKNLLIQLKKPELRPEIKKEREPINRPVDKQKSLVRVAESLLLRIYLHCPKYREEIINNLEEKDLNFLSYAHSFLWEKILELQAEQPELLGDKENQLISQVQNRMLEYPEEMTQVSQLFYIDEEITGKQGEDIDRTPLIMRAALNSLEQAVLEGRKRYCVEMWNKLDLATERSRQEYYSQEIINLRQRIYQLEKQRSFSIIDITKMSSF